MGLVLKHVIRTKAGTLHYRRRLPRDVAEVVGKGEFKRLLGSTEREALKHYPKVHAEFERLVAGARRRVEMGAIEGGTALELHKAAERRALELADMVVTIGGRTLTASDPDAADILRERILAQLPADDETGDPIGDGCLDGRAISILSNGGSVSRPAATVEDARRLYLREKISGDIDERSKEQRLDRIIGHMVAAGVPKTRPLASLTREDARNVRDHMLRDLGMKPATARRYLNDVRAVINFGLTEFDLRDAQNPFLNLPIKIDTPAIEERHPISEEMLPAIRKRVQGHGAAALWQLWRIMEGTGARLGEVSGLMIADLRLDADIPHFVVTSHPHRRIKTASSIRLVPLVGEALEATKEARKAAGDSLFLFPDYGRAKGATAASAALMKHVRTVTDDPKINNHSLRHTMEDRMTLAGIDVYDRALVVGHAMPGMSGRYGSQRGRLEAASKAVAGAAKVAEMARKKRPRPRP